MILTRLSADGFRNLKQVSLVPSPGINLILGTNGAGKSSLLESIQCLSTGHSFRTRKPRDLIAHGADEFLLTCEMLDPSSGQEHRSGLIRRIDGTVDLKLDFETLRSFQTVTQYLPVKALTPESHGLVQEGPHTRRQFMDWGVFHVEPLFIAAWRDFRRALLQRNTALRLARPDSEVSTWDSILVKNAELIDSWRKAYVARLVEDLTELANTLELKFRTELHYRSGWAEDRSFSEALAGSLDHSRKMKTTTVGPHRGDLSLQSDGHMARAVLSRGQQKSLVYAMELAQLQVLKRATGQKAIVLCDDLQAELDRDSLERVLSLLSDLDLQIFVTATSTSGLRDRAASEFHIEHGRVTGGVVS